MDHSTIEAFAETFAKAPRLAEMEIRSASQGTLRFRRSLQSSEKKPRPPTKPLSAVTAVSDAQVTPQSPETTGSVVTSTLVGIFRLSSKFPIMVGSTVAAGQSIGAIEVMRLSDDITAPVAGEIASIFVQDGQPVEYGQALFEITPVATEEGQASDA